ncbi:DUF2461 domain-containing protein [Mangrovimonas sp. CR14]|uniref:DUF2461 domain-containing protein n=1 Tax=Mangrovimonas sp. CR14 TaxID=2706120 RepID=UPI0014214E55|nr:DUF2461 domain-containing protein [Mangrovimonas sp. CR14]NIK91859.1 DUF2461 domain-containing protein [Mangrovimonas sp. CR14]
MATQLTSDIFTFLNQLKSNNNRDWFNDHKKEFKGIQKEVKNFYEMLFSKLKMHDEVDNLKIFRIYRDVRFSKNKEPYKIHFGGSFHRKKPELRGGYYLHLSPNNESFMATGFWEPNKDDLNRIRREFEMDASEMRDLLADPKFKSVWGDLQGDELKTAPRDFEKDHPNIDLIRKKQYIFIKKYSDKEVLSENFLDDVDKSFQLIRPYFDYMSDVLTTNLNGESVI